MALVIVSICVLVVLTVWILAGVRIVRPFERGVVERLGKFRTTVGPGLRTMRPLVDTMHMIDMREQVLELTSTGVMTKDCVAVDVDAAVFYVPVQPEVLLYAVADFREALTMLSHTGVRTAVGELPVDEALTARTDIGMRLRTTIDDTSRTWGVEVRRVEVHRVEAPADLVAAMVEQAKAERVGMRCWQRPRASAGRRSPGPRASRRRRRSGPRASGPPAGSTPKPTRRPSASSTRPSGTARSGPTRSPPARSRC